jgi:hypothetical protein
LRLEHAPIARGTSLDRPASPAQFGWKHKTKGTSEALHPAVSARVGWLHFFYQTIEHRRTRKGSWQVSFTRGTAGAPTLLIAQPRPAITNVQISFSGETLPVTTSQSTITTLCFAQPRPVPYEVPFGKCVFMDTTFLPGTITFELFGHEIELLPRALARSYQSRITHHASRITHHASRITAFTVEALNKSNTSRGAGGTHPSPSATRRGFP